MDQFSIKTTILKQWLSLPEQQRRSEQDAAGFVLRLMVERPELARMPASTKPYKLIKSWLCETLPKRAKAAQH